MIKLCLECSQTLLGRSDKKFCSDLCRNAYNNKANADANNFVRNTNNALRRNRKILEELCKDDKAKVAKNILLEKGFDFNMLTNLRKTMKGAVYFFVYEFGYLALENDIYLIVKDKKAM